MKKRAFIVHGWSGNPNQAWLPWLKHELEDRGFSVMVPAMPETDHPTIEAWVEHLRAVVGSPNQDTFFIGGSIGCQTILRFLESLPAESQVGGAVFVAPWFTLMGLETDEELRIAKPWLETPIDLTKVKRILPSVVAIFSDNDPVVPLENMAMFEHDLRAKTVLLHEKEHFDETPELPEALNAVLGMAR